MQGDVKITSHGQQEQKHQFSQFSALIPPYHEMILTAESCMSQAYANSSLRLLKSAFEREKSKNGGLQNLQ